MKSLPRYATPVFLLVALLACTLVAPLPPTTAPAGAAAATAPAPAFTASAVPTNKAPVAPKPGLPALPRGLTAVNDFEPARQGEGLFTSTVFDDRTYANPNIAGLTFRASWEEIEPAQGNFVWTKLDSVFDKAAKNGKWVELVLIPGFATPAWALEGVQTASFSVVYGQGKGETLALPLPWDQTYLDRWFAFLKAVSARYQARPEFLKIAADGPTSVTAETSLPDASADLCTWMQVGYTSDKLIAAWKQVFDQYAQIFPRQYFSVALYPPLPIVSTSRCNNGNPRAIDHSESQRVTAAIAKLGAEGYPEHFVLQENGLTAARNNAPALGTYEVVKGYVGKIVIGYQLTTSAINHPTDMGDPDGATALQKSLQQGLDAKVQFLEVWEPDVLSPAAQNVLAAAASALAAVAPPAVAAATTATATAPASAVATTAPTATPASAVAATTPIATPSATAPSTATEGVRTARGVFIVTGHNVAIKPDTFANPAVDGIMIRTFWSNVEPAPNQFDWSFIDSQVQAASASGKKVILTVLPGAFTPSWALQGVQSAQFTVDYGFMQGSTITLPLPWDATYLKRWFAFVGALGQRYGSNPAVVNVPAAGPTSISEEMSLPNDRAAVKKWEQLGYSLKSYEDAWQQTLAAYTQAFPSTQISLTFYPGLPIPDAAAGTATRVDVADFAFSHFGRHIAFQENGLSARKGTPALGYDLVQQYSSKTGVGFEMGTSATEKPDQMGGSTAAAALQASVDLGLKAGTSFLVIYEKDALNPDLQPILASTHAALTK